MRALCSVAAKTLLPSVLISVHPWLEISPLPSHWHRKGFPPALPEKGRGFQRGSDFRAYRFVTAVEAPTAFSSINCVSSVESLRANVDASPQILVIPSK